MLALGLAQAEHVGPAARRRRPVGAHDVMPSGTIHASSARAACMRFSAWSHTRLAGRVEHLVGHLVAPVGREAVQEHGAGGRPAHERRVHLIGTEDRSALVGLGLLAHRVPRVGVDHVGALGGLLWLRRHEGVDAGGPEAGPTSSGDGP